MVEIDKGVNVIEIGFGIGVLIEFLVENVVEVMVFEIDDCFIFIFVGMFVCFDNV